MPDPVSAAVRYRSNAAKFSELSKDAVNPFFRDYYERLSQRYLMHAENQERIAWISEGSATARRNDDPMPDGPFQAAPRAVSPEEAPASAQPTSPAPSQPVQNPARASRRKRRRHRDH
jgi:hypothetical protein